MSLEVAPKYVSERWEKWDRFDRVTFIQCMELTLGALAPNTEWQETELYQRWCHYCCPHLYSVPLEPPLTHGEVYRLACDLYARTLAL